MKTSIFILGFILMFSLSGCILVEVNQPRRNGGPPAWAPAHGYRKKNVVIYNSPGHIIIKKGKGKK